MNNNTSINRKEYIQCSLCILLTSILIFIFAPLEFYLSNKESFYFGIYDLLPYLLALFVATTIGLLIIYCLLQRICPKLYQVLITIQFLLTIAMYIQGNFIPNHYGSLNGTVIDWSNYVVDGIISNGLFIAIIASMFIIYIKMPWKKLLKGYSTLSICIILVQLITLTTLMIQTNCFEKNETYVCTTKDEFSYSDKQNLIVLLLDNCDGKLFSDLFETERDAMYSSVFEDFTFYSDAMTMYSATDLSIPQILTGQNYKNEQPYGDFVNTAFEKSPLLNTLKENEWNNYVYTIQVMPQENANDMITNLEYETITVSSHKRLLSYMYKLVGFRYMPQVFKPYFWFYPDDMNSIKDIKNANGRKIYDWSNFTFYDSIPSMSSDNERKSFHFYHLEGTHTPYSMQSDFTLSNEEVGVEEEAKGITILIDEFLSNLKATGVYDNSAIVIMADHGCFDMRQHPILFIKGINEHHNLQQSDNPVSYQDIQEAMIRLANGSNSDKAFDEKENTERTFYYYDDSNLNRTSHSNTIIEYKTTSTASDYAALAPSGVEY